MASSTGNQFSSTDQYSEDIVREFLHDVDAMLAEDRSVDPCEANAVFKSADDDYKYCLALFCLRITIST